jgi:hypothetical protein
LILGTQYDVLDESHQQTATVLNNVVLALGVLTGVINSIIPVIIMSEPKVTK